MTSKSCQIGCEESNTFIPDSYDTVGTFLLSNFVLYKRSLSADMMRLEDIYLENVLLHVCMKCIKYIIILFYFSL